MSKVFDIFNIQSKKLSNKSSKVVSEDGKSALGNCYFLKLLNYMHKISNILRIE